MAIRLGRGFAKVEAREGHRLYAGAAVPDAVLAREAAKAGIAGLEFYRGRARNGGRGPGDERRLLRLRDPRGAGAGLRRHAGRRDGRPRP
ncbi:MAG: hypothetical protein WDN45_07580 [Caulobacteraceae bacterium]